jgi:hypothetical protein
VHRRAGRARPPAITEVELSGDVFISQECKFSISLEVGRCVADRADEVVEALTLEDVSRRRPRLAGT